MLPHDAAVTGNLSLTTAQNTGGAGIDTLAAIENIIGTDFRDVFTGTSANNVFDGGGFCWRNRHAFRAPAGCAEHRFAA